ncbi:LysM peptidoglycan-binding domain-containing protein [Ruegeria sp. EL01]|uniref:LysM peptidoglycan-binding domain-containing protein n=1 Tax=Ruegeria sp. EL01 TaxID=2107578 RepID=UPI000EA82700|nr:LysM peptidoglycan-binding domain-containing protein [Ruegeria sp. EL01]
MDAKSGNGNSGNFIWGVIAGLIAILGAGGLYLSGAFTSAPEPKDAPQEQTASAPAPETEQLEQSSAPTEGGEGASETAEQTAETPAGQPAVERGEEVTDTGSETASADGTEEGATAPTTTPPVLDQIFVETDGNALLSGSAEPGSEIQVLLNGEPVHEFTADSSGKFAEFVSIPFSDDAQGLVLQTTQGDQTARSDDYLIAALPEPAEEQVASAETSAQPEVGPTETPEQPTTAGAAETTDQSEDVTETASTEAPSAEPGEDTSKDQQVAVLRSGEEGVELVQSPSRQDTDPEQVALDTIGYSDTGDVQLTGRVQDGSAVRLYLNNELVADLAPEEDGNWRGELEGIDPGVYTLRVDEVSSDGTVLSRVETPFKREPVEVLQSAEAEDQPQASDETPSIRSVTVQKGDTLWAISRDRFGDGVLYVKLFDANRELIRDPDLIYPGQVFTIPQ